MVPGEPSARHNSDRQTQAWGTGLIGRVLLCLPVIAFVAVAVIATRDPEFPRGLLLVGLVFTGPLALAGLRAGQSVRLTANELIVRWPIGSRRISRADVVSAQFGLFGLHIRLRDGGTVLAPLAPKWWSTELSSGGEPEVNSAAYQITRWAQSQEPPED